MVRLSDPPLTEGGACARDSSRRVGSLWPVDTGHARTALRSTCFARCRPDPHLPRLTSQVRLTNSSSW